MYTFVRGGNKIPVKIPLSTAQCVIIPSNQKGTGFRRQLFKQNRQFLGGLFDRDEFDSVVDQSSKLVSKVYSHNRKKDVEGISMAVIISLCATTLLLFGYFFLMYYGIRDDKRELRIAGYFALAISVFVTSIIGIVNCCTRPEKYTPFKDMVRKTLRSFFERINRKMENRGVELFIVDNHFWIEVRINQAKAANYRKQMNYDPIRDPGSDEDEDNNGSARGGPQTDGPLIT